MAFQTLMRNQWIQRSASAGFLPLEDIPKGMIMNNFYKS